MSDRVLLFRRDFRGLTGGHLKVWDYFNHTRSSVEFLPRIFISCESLRDHRNPWMKLPDSFHVPWNPECASVLFLAGLDWEELPLCQREFPGRPVINLIQGLRHFDPNDARHGFLAHPAIRICVSNAIKMRLLSLPQVSGPVFLIPPGIPDIEEVLSVTRDTYETRGDDVFVAALKNRSMGEDLAEILRANDINVDLLASWKPRREFLERMTRARVVVLLPLQHEGFYLPAVEAMSAGKIVVMPRIEASIDYAIDGENCMLCDSSLESLARTTLHALRLKPEDASRIKDRATKCSSRFSVDRERRDYLSILNRVDDIWRQI